MNLHELCEAYRNKKRWYIETGSQEAVSTCRTGLFTELGIPITNNIPNGNHWELYREISFRVMEREPFLPVAPVEDSTNELHSATAEDMVTIGKCIAKAMRL